MVTPSLQPLAATTDDIKKLDDEQLRALLIRLCEAELTEARLPLSGLTAGGHQNANDGGVDVAVSPDSPGTAFLPAFPVFLQSKAEAMRPAKISDEMCPGGTLRSVIVNLGKAGGTYVIACNKENCSHSQLIRRQNAMAAAVADAPDAQEVTLRFYDADMLARWTTQHSGVSLWLADVTGAPRHGWQAFGCWSSAEDSKEEPYLLVEDNRACLTATNELISTEQALTYIRVQLHAGRSVVRLVGLSGMGKTRFAQALFDACVGENSLNPNLAVYGDASLPHLQPPELLVADLVRRRRPAVVVLDNCPGNLHRRVVDQVRHPDSQVSLLTIDFDIGDDRPTATTVVRLEHAEDDIINALLKRRAPHLVSDDRHRIVNFSGGNARIALALAQNSAGQSLARLRDQELLGRLFLDSRRNPDEDLWRTARAASLVYALEIGAGIESPELATLARIANVSPATFYEKTSLMLERGLTQQRGTQRAVMPQALAARIASEALKLGDPSMIERVMTREAPNRLRRSFVRRLSVLHEIPAAVAIAESLLKSGLPFREAGWSQQHIWEAFVRLAPLAPARSLEIIVEFLKHADPTNFEVRWSVRDHCANLLIALAREVEFFPVAARALAHVALHLFGDSDNSRVRLAFCHLFYPSLAATAADPDARFAVVAEMLSSTEPKTAQLGIDALLGSLSRHHEQRVTRVDLGARPRSAGWKPKSGTEQAAWFDQSLSLAERFVLSQGASDTHRSLVAKRIVGLAYHPVVATRAAAMIRAVSARRYWWQMWFAVCERIYLFRHDKRDPPTELLAIERELHPTTLDERFDAWVVGLACDWRDPFVYDEDHDSFETHGQYARELGKEIASDPEARLRLLARNLADIQAAGYYFGLGIAQGTTEPETVWQEIISELNQVPRNSVNILPVCGYIREVFEHEPTRAARWLSEAAKDAALMPWIVYLHCFTDLQDPNASEHMLFALRQKVVGPADFRRLQYGRVTHRLPNQQLARILVNLCRQDGGAAHAVEVMHSRYHGADEAPVDHVLIRAGQTILRAYATNRTTSLRIYDLELVAERCLAGDPGRFTATYLAEKLRRPWPKPEARENRQELLEAIFKHHPLVGLDALFGREDGPDPNDDAVWTDDDEDVFGPRVLDTVPPRHPAALDRCFTRKACSATGSAPQALRHSG